MSDLVHILTYMHRHEAEMIKDILLQNGIESMIVAGDLGGLKPHLIQGTGSIKLFVRKDQEESARQIIDDFGIFEADS